MKKVVVRSKRELEGLKWTAKVIDFGVSIAIMAAFNQIANAWIVLRDSGLLKQKARHKFNIAYTKMNRRRYLILSTMKDEKFYDSFAEASIDASLDDVQQFKKELAKTLSDNKAEYAEAFAEAETARALLHSAYLHYHCVLKEACEKFGYTYDRYFPEYNCGDVFSAWDCACAYLFRNAHIELNNKETNEKFDRLLARFADGDYVAQSVEEAVKENPQFANHFELTKENAL